VEPVLVRQMEGDRFEYRLPPPSIA
jgi:hypothetical protein